jgi:hypothetical protein
VIVEPYRRTPARVELAAVDEQGRLVDEHGAQVDEPRPRLRVYIQQDLARQLVERGAGEMLCWNNEPVRWRADVLPLTPEGDWQRGPLDAYVIRLPHDLNLPSSRFMAALKPWRDWLERWGAGCTGTTGSCAWSLLRATLTRTLTTSTGRRPPIGQTRGGRIQLGPQGPGLYRGLLEHWDLPAAYAATLGGLRYGGVWMTAQDAGRTPSHWAELGCPVFAHAKVQIPKRLEFGPLLRFQRRRLHFAEMEVLSAARYPDGTPWLYPIGRRVQGVWTWQELEAAVAAGARIVKLGEVWVHRSGWQPFARWWEAVQDGRRMPGLAGALAKMTGNALWGRFALDAGAAGERSRVGGGVKTLLPERPGAFPAHDLAETVSGRVRAELFRRMMEEPGAVLSAHTDGLWLQAGENLGARPPAATGWTLKEQASRLDLLEPACLRYWPARSPDGRPRHVLAGVPAFRQPAEFEERWQNAGLDPVYS